MSATRERPRLSGEELLRLEQVCDRFESCWRKGERATIESQLEDATGVLRERLIDELIAIEVEYRRRAGESPTSLEYQARFSLSSAAARRLVPLDATEAGPQRTRHDIARDRVVARDQRPTETLDATASERFELRERLGAGAFGTVWRAWDRKLSRDVALKLAHRTLVDAPDKFLREARASARLQHPHIVRVLDVGETEEGLFIVREFVAGRTLSEVLKQEPVELTRSVRWCQQLAEALDYIHGKGCIHRDLKPQNVLIDDAGVSFLCDFGLAKSNVTAAITQTRTGDVLGTPAYMAPEQARGDSHRVDPRSDIYSLGVILYQLLTGELPFRGSFERILIQVLRDEPPRPSALNPKVPADLATICLKCLQKEPEARYSTARELADDLQRYVEGRPVAARPLGWLRRVARWSRRNPALAASFGSIGLLLAVLLAMGAANYRQMATSWREERFLRQQADAARIAAERQAERARVEARVSDQVTRFLETVFATSDPVGRHLEARQAPLGERVTARQLLDHAVARLDVELAGQPQVQARLLDTLGDVYRALGLLEQADQLLRRAETSWDECRPQSTPGALDAEEATHALRVARLRQAEGKYVDAEARYAQADQTRRQLYGVDSLEVAEIDFHRGMSWIEQRRPREARVCIEAALAKRRAQLDESDRRIALARLALWQCSAEEKGDLASLDWSEFADWGNERTAAAADAGLRLLIARRTNDPDAARRAYVQLIDLARRELAGNHPLLALLLGDYADFLYRQGDYRTAEPAIREALEIGRRLAPRHPRVRDALQRLCYETLMAGRYEDAAEEAREALACGFTNPIAETQTQFDLACALMALDRLEEARQWSERVMARHAETSPVTRAWYGYVHARLLGRLGDETAAAAQDKANLTLLEQVDAENQPPIWQLRLATIEAHAGRLGRAEQLARAAWKREEETRPADHPRIAEKLVAVARYCDRQQRSAEAIPLLERALAIQSTRLPEDDRRPADTRRLLEDIRKRVAN